MRAEVMEFSRVLRPEATVLAGFSPCARMRDVALLGRFS